MLNRYKKPALLAGLGVSTLTLGALLTALTSSQTGQPVPFLGQPSTSTANGATNVATQPGQKGQSSPTSQSTQPSAVFPLVSLLSPEQRAAKLESIVKGFPSIDRNRARFLRASDLASQGKYQDAIAQYNGLENDYPELAPYVLIRRAQAYTALGDSANALKTWQDLVGKYPNDPAVVEGLFQLGQQNPQYWDQAIAKFPAHPRSIEIAQTRLRQNPKQLNLLLVLARYGVYLDGITGVLDRIRTEYAAQLKPEDWEAIAFAYWENQAYNNASIAYAQAPPSALNLYRAGRGAHLSERGTDAIKYYEQVIQAFPQEEETGMALLRLADLAKTPESRIAFADRVIREFPDKGAAALLKKADAFQDLNSPQTAQQLRQTLLTQYSASEEAAEVRWEQAEANVKKGDIKAAWQWAQQLVQESPDSEYAAEAAFWVGKWAQQSGMYKEAKQSFEFVLANYPETYYAWRSATLLGWEVGDFTTVRQKLPHIVKPGQRAIPPAGSKTLRELYQLGQDWDAWSRWQIEYQQRVNPTVAEQFTDGLMRLGVNDNLEGMFMIASLANREKAAEHAEYKALKKQNTYWNALYPFPFMNHIEKWSYQRQINPMLVTALIRQESRFEPKIKSVVGATGLMQLMPETAAWVADQVNLKNYNKEDPDNNVNMGTWYLDYTHREYNNNSLFAVASYNAGPGAVADWIQRYGFTDPDKFVEQIPYPETKGYVKHVFENYWNYLRLYNPEISQKMNQFLQSR